MTFNIHRPLTDKHGEIDEDVACRRARVGSRARTAAAANAGGEEQKKAQRKAQRASHRKSR